jgi:hypothetical protein
VLFAIALACSLSFSENASFTCIIFFLPVVPCKKNIPIQLLLAMSLTSAVAAAVALCGCQLLLPAPITPTDTKSQ